MNIKIKKLITWETSAGIIAFLMSWIAFGEPVKSVVFGVVATVVFASWYWTHEYLWEKWLNRNIDIES